MNSDLINSLEEIINEGIEQMVLPYKKGNSIRIKHMIIRKSNAGWLVYDSKCNLQIAKLFSKSSAIALAKGIAQKKDVLNQVQYADQVIKKNYIDCIFYKNILKKTNDSQRKAVTEIRCEVSLQNAQSARKSLDSIIFG
jgi:hypothetical protein